MMKYMWIVITMQSACLLACNKTRNRQEGEVIADKNASATTLSKLPALYSGYVGCNSSDSILLELWLNTDLQYILNKTIQGKIKSNTDTATQASGEWIVNDSIVRLYSGSPPPSLSRYRTISADQLQLLDSAGTEIKNGKNYILTRNDSVVNNLYQ